MKQFGRYPKFPINRKLTKEEYENKLKPGKYKNQHRYKNQSHAFRGAHEFLTTIKMNSSYLEVVDRCFPIRGSLVNIGAYFFGLGLFLAISIIVTPINPNIPRLEPAILMSILLSIFSSGAYTFFKAELFNLTHNPIRFDRRNRMVYAFLYTKNKMAALPWDDVYFCISGHSGHFDIRGHILDDDKTVLDTFAIGPEISPNDIKLQYYWRFIDYYMAKGPEDLLNKVKFCLPIADQKEPPKWALNSLINEYGHGFYLLFPLMMLAWGCRMLATATSKIPVWPDWVEEKCQIDPDDPFVRDASTNPPVPAFTNILNIQLTASGAVDDEKWQPRRAAADAKKIVTKKIEVAKTETENITAGDAPVENATTVNSPTNESPGHDEVSADRVLGIIIAIILGTICTAIFVAVIIALKP